MRVFKSERFVITMMIILIIIIMIIITTAREDDNDYVSLRAQYRGTTQRQQQQHRVAFNYDLN